MKKNLLTKFFLILAIVIIIAMGVVAYALPYDLMSISSRQILFVVFDSLAIFLISASSILLFRGAWGMFSVQRRSMCLWLVRLSLFACIFVLFPVFLEQWNIILRAVLVAGLALVAVVALAITYYLSFSKS